MGLNEGVNGGHFSYAAPGMTDQFLAIPNGLHWAEVTPENLILVDHQGHTLEGLGRIERSNLHIHAGIHGVGDLDAATRDWRNPVALITVRRLR